MLKVVGFRKNKDDKLTDNFDIQAYLDDENIEYFTEGKNCTSGWVQVSCPFCNDTSNHMGINLTSKLFSCWKCSERGGPAKLIMALEDCSFSKAKSKLHQYQNYGLEYEEQEKVRSEKIKIPGGVTATPSKIQKKYLEQERRFEIGNLIENYKIMFGPPFGVWRHRIIIPYFYKNKIVTISSRDVTGNIEPKYYHLPIEQSILDVKSTVYNIDKMGDTAIIVEGAIDVWRLGDGAISFSGVTFTSAQLLMLQNKKPKKAFIIFDEDADKMAEKLANSLPFIDHVEVINLGGGDPADMSEQDVLSLKKFLLI